MQHLRAKLLITVSSILAASLASADGTAGHLGWMVNLNANFGGDEVAKLYFTDSSTQSVKAGDGVGFAVGGHYRLPDSGLDFSTTIGLKYVSTKAKNADIHLNRTALEFLGTYLFQNNTWLSAGITQHHHIKFDGDGYAPNVKFNNASGTTFKAGWKAVGLNYTKMEYKASAPYVGTFNADSFGFELVGRF